MPTYEYRCLKCGKHFDILQSIKDRPLARCIHCKGKVERLIGSGAGIIFKGSGFYQTDYKKTSKPKDNEPIGTPVRIRGHRLSVMRRVSRALIDGAKLPSTILTGRDRSRGSQPSPAREKANGTKNIHAMP